MRTIKTKDVTSKVYQACYDACHILNDHTLSNLKECLKNETSNIGKEILTQIIKNDELAKSESIPMCQDTGIVVCFLEVGFNCTFDGNVYDAINEGIKNAYNDFYLRKSVADPITRINTSNNTPGIIHTKFIEGDNVKITIAPKGAGSENMSKLKMLNPTDGIEGIKKFVLDSIKEADGRPCPPIVVGIGIGGNFEKSALLAKEALLREKNSDDETIKKLELDLKDEINKLNIGPMGLGGKTTCLDVFINKYPCHIASLPVSINIQCHANRHVEVIL